MIIKSIKLENFRQYKELSVIKFATDKERNVTVILGGNTCGKTTFVHAFTWCFYGESNFKSNTSLLNEESKLQLESSMDGATKIMSVEIELIHDNKEYTLKRTLKYKKEKSRLQEIENFIIFTNDNGNQNQILDKDKDDTIKTILPKELSKFFFFWGERIENISNVRDLKDSIKSFLGLSKLDKASRHVQGAIKKFKSDLANEQKNDSYLTKYHNELIKNEEILKNIEFKKSKLIEDLNHYEEKREVYFSNLFSGKNAEIADAQKKIEDCNKNLEIMIERRQNNKNYFIKKFNDKGPMFFSTVLAERAKKILEGVGSDVKGWAYVDINTIKEILEKKRCICGTDLDENQDLIDYLNSQMEIVSPNVIGQQIQLFINDINNKTTSTKEYVVDLKNAYETLLNNIDDIDVLEAERIKLYEITDGKENMLDKRKDYDELLKKCQDKKSQKAVYEHQIENTKRLIEKNKFDYNSVMHKKHKDNENTIFINYANAVLNSIKNEYEDKEKNLKEKLQGYISKYFTEMYTGERSIALNDEYKIQLYNTVDGKKVQNEPSPGLETVKNFAFIAALVQVAKEQQKANLSSEDQLMSEPYPLVLDAPFSSADEKHVSAISSLISNVAEQTILVVMEKDWEHAKEELKDKIGIMYKLTKHSETNTKILLHKEEI